MLLDRRWEEEQQHIKLRFYIQGTRTTRTPVVVVVAALRCLWLVLALMCNGTATIHPPATTTTDRELLLEMGVAGIEIIETTNRSASSRSPVGVVDWLVG